MPKTKEEQFWKACEAKASELAADRPLKQHLSSYWQAFSNAATHLQNLDSAKRKAHLTKWKVLENLDRYLIDFEANFTRAGGKVIWANNAEEALEELDKLLAAYAPDAVISNHAMIHEEIGLPAHLSASKYREEQSDLGRYLVQLAKKKPTHVIHPAIELDAADIERCWLEKHPANSVNKSEADPTDEENDIAPLPDEPFHLLAQFRDYQRQRIKRNAVTLSGADHLIADTGSVVISENEGNDRLFTAFTNYHIVFAGIDKVLPSLLDLDLFLPLGALHDQGQRLQAHHTLFTGSRAGRETDGPAETVLILIDNGRSDLLSLTEQRQALYWMECGASTNACAIYESIGGAAYQTTYPGPMGAVFTPHLQTDESYQYLDHAASFSKMKRPSPLDIDIPRLLLKNRHDRIAETEKAAPESRLWRWYARLAKNRKYADWMTKGLKNLFIKLLFKKSWGDQRALPRVLDKSFSLQWRSKGDG